MKAQEVICDKTKNKMESIFKNLVDLALFHVNISKYSKFLF